MNEQKPPNAIEWTRCYGRRGFTWNVITGCEHECRWTMPDGNIAICYAEHVAENVAKDHYPQGFAHHYFHPERLNEPLKMKEPAGIFLDSMSDLMGTWVPEDEIQQVLDVCAKADWHIFMLLTKNAPRLLKFKFPPNVWVGASTPPDFMWGKELKQHQKYVMLERTLAVLAQIDAVTWLSAEPLSWDISSFVRNEPTAIDWIVIGAASNGRQEFAPRLEYLKAVEKVVDSRDIPVFYKGNLRSLKLEWWRESFPNSQTPRVRVIEKPPTQLALPF